MEGEILATARQALEQGDYGRVLRLLEPIAAERSPATPIGAGVRLLIATALIGQGRTDQAAACCRTLLSCRDAGLRARARDLLTVLEAPELRRPREWSLTLPVLTDVETLEAGGRRRPARSALPAEPPPPPPVGPTRPPLGFAALAAVLLVGLLLASLLGGCMQVRTDMEFAGPGRLRISHHLRSASGRLTPWQRHFGEVLAAGSFHDRSTSGEQVLETPVLPAAQALDALAVSFAAAVDDLAVPPPTLLLEERNWLVGVRQHLLLDLDLRATPPLPGLELAMRLAPASPAAVRHAEPHLPEARGDGAALLWRLESGSRNRLELRCWRWNPLGVGALLISLGLAMVLVLQRIRLRLGFGLPELPS